MLVFHLLANDSSFSLCLRMAFSSICLLWKVSMATYSSFWSRALQ